MRKMEHLVASPRTTHFESVGSLGLESGNQGEKHQPPENLPSLAARRLASGIRKATELKESGQQGATTTRNAVRHRPAKRALEWEDGC